MRLHTDKEILDVAGLYPPAPNTVEGDIFNVTVLVDEVKYHVIYKKAIVAHMLGWEPIEISQ